MWLACIIGYFFIIDGDRVYYMMCTCYSRNGMEYGRITIYRLEMRPILLRDSKRVGFRSVVIGELKVVDILCVTIAHW